MMIFRCERFDKGGHYFFGGEWYKYRVEIRWIIYNSPLPHFASLTVFKIFCVNNIYLIYVQILLSLKRLAY